MPGAFIIGQLRDMGDHEVWLFAIGDREGFGVNAVGAVIKHVAMVCDYRQLSAVSQEIG